MPGAVQDVITPANFCEDQLRNLLISDKNKRGLSEPCLKYVLFIESATKTGWLGIGKESHVSRC